MILPKETSTVIYCIWNNANDKCYVGSTQNYRRRILKHLNLLKRNKHHSWKLQRDYNKFDINDFECFILKNSTIENLIEDEQWCLDIINCYYNVLANARNSLGRKMTKETKDKIIEYMKNRPKSHNENLSKSLKANKDFLEKTSIKCKLMCENNKKPLTVENIISKEIMEFNSAIEASVYLKINRSTLVGYASGTRKSDTYKKQYKIKYK